MVPALLSGSKIPDFSYRLLNKLGCSRGQPLDPIFCPTVFNKDVIPLDIPAFLQSLPQGDQQVQSCLR
jgi:hypothetical protein